MITVSVDVPIDDLVDELTEEQLASLVPPLDPSLNPHDFAEYTNAAISAHGIDWLNRWLRDFGVEIREISRW